MIIWRFAEENYYHKRLRCSCGWLNIVGSLIKRWRDHLQRFVELPKCHKFIASWLIIVRATVATQHAKDIIILSIILDLNVYGNNPVDMKDIMADECDNVMRRI